MTIEFPSHCSSSSGTYFLSFCLPILIFFFHVHKPRWLKIILALTYIFHSIFLFRTVFFINFFIWILNFSPLHFHILLSTSNSAIQNGTCPSKFRVIWRASFQGRGWFGEGLGFRFPEVDNFFEFNKNLSVVFNFQTRHFKIFPYMQYISEFPH